MPTAAAQGACCAGGKPWGQSVTVCPRGICRNELHNNLAEVTAERAVLAHLDGSCHTPIAASAVCGDDGQMHIDAMILRPDGEAAHRRQHTGPSDKAAMLGEELGAALLDDAGGREFLA